MDNLDKYSSSKGNKSLLCNIFDGIGINHNTISSGEQNIDKVNVSIVGIIQPEFALPTIEAGNDSHSLYRHFLPVHLTYYFHIIMNLLTCQMKYILS